MTETDNAIIIRNWTIDIKTTHIYKVSLAERECAHGECHAIGIRGVGCEACEDRTWREGGVEAVEGHGGEGGGGAGVNRISKLLSERKDEKKISRPLVHFIQL
jgi:hypothetical protein